MRLGFPMLSHEPDSPFGTTLPLVGFAVLGAFAACVTIWSVAAPLQSAVIAPGVVSLDSNVRTVQHLEGGIVSQILVREGELVHRGQPLVRLAHTPAAANLNEIKAQFFDALATEARLVAMRDGAARISFPEELRASKDPMAVSAVRVQENVFRNSNSLLADRLSGQAAAVASSASEAQGFKQQAQQARERLSYLDQQLRLFKQLEEKGLVSKVRVLGLQQQKAELQGSVSGYEAASSGAGQKVDQFRSQLSETRAAAAQDVLGQLSIAQTRAYDLRQKLSAAEDVANRIEIRAPADGAVVGLRVHTVGGVVGPGEVLMNIVPMRDELIVQANVNPDDIDQVTTGLPAAVWLTTITRRNGYPVEGQVRTISADRLIDEKTGTPYYLARISLDRASLRGRAIALQPGMSARVQITTGSRSALQYLLGPLFRSMSFASR